MNEEKIIELLKKDNYIDLVKELLQIFPEGFDFEKIDKRISKRLNELQNKNYSIQEPIQIRKIK